MADFCDAWRSASSHPLFDFKACKCDGVDATGFPASKACGNSAARLVGILAPILIIVVIVCWMRGIKRGLKELALFMAGLFIGVPGLFLIWFYKKFARGDAVVDTALHKFHKQSGPVVKLKVVCVKQEPVLPTELCDAVISACDDQETLLACSRVCIAWTHMSRRQLSVAARVTSYSRSKRVGSLLRSRSQTIAPWKIYGQHWRILRLFKLKGIQLRCATFRRRAHFIESLTFHAQPARELRHFLSQALQFTRLKSLTVSIDLDIVPGWNPKLRGDPTPDERPWTIGHLKLCGTWSDDLALWLQKRCRKLARLEIHTIGDAHIAQCGCAIKILQLLDGKYPPSEIVILAASQSCLGSHAAAFDNVVINSLRMSLGERQSSLFRYVHNTLD
ncbi:hypothetical protein BDZ89DRAFT_1078755 [Hymenopellis radicata]|nr:hypothetical protein BDZ89DRAFT_1078755 [Hymenopellis radicata]